MMRCCLWLVGGKWLNLRSPHTLKDSVQCFVAECCSAASSNHVTASCCLKHIFVIMHPKHCIKRNPHSNNSTNSYFFSEIAEFLTFLLGLKQVMDLKRPSLHCSCSSGMSWIPLSLQEPPENGLGCRDYHSCVCRTKIGWLPSKHSLACFTTAPETL